ncbi:SCO7613 C-terminal domain-containing membrane protein [Streptomyces platensis]|uniref:SCO7613 C-terminal domain-containing membrane protein n=1 Tax=Streptomyces platensis TaxID=58346 RepID=UPI0036893C8C
MRTGCVRYCWGGAALLATVVGVRTRLQAPLAVGGCVLVLVGLHELAPTVAQVFGLLPRWVPVAAAGLLLLLLGATYEKRIDEARRLRDTVRSMT